MYMITIEYGTEWAMASIGCTVGTEQTDTITRI